MEFVESNPLFQNPKSMSYCMLLLQHGVGLAFGRLICSLGVVVLEIVSGLKAVDFRQPEVLLVNKVHEFEVRKTPLEALADMGLNGEYNLKELMRLAVEPISMGAGVLPNSDGADGEVMYIRARFQRIVGSRDSKAFYMMNPDSNGAPELSIYLLRV
ncbi:Protein MIZU-KUSSEI 1 [Glycine soja]|uniref:Protein MIZU-KUSSEI 1 n=1 Tax=Glycine soja TaxID=3848 RepID=A0A445H6W5_GLYSO|nr:Protein MIZU-KUSSEI 1 [Glycine soja]